MRLDRTVAALEKGRVDGYHPGAQLEVVLHGEVVGSVAIGDARPGVAMAVDTLLPWFSCTKAVTAAAVAQQWERGRVDLDAPVAAYLPEFAAGGKDAITLRHVLTHTGGFRSVEGSVWRGSWDEAVAMIAAAPLEDGWVPGERAGYHDVTGFMILGEVVRRVDPHGRSFADYVSEEIFEPLDMPDSWIALTERRFEAYGDRVGFMYDTSKKAEPRVIPGYEDGRAFRKPQPSGSGVGPMRDLVRFAEMLRCRGELDGHRVLATETVDAMLTPQRVGLVDETFGMVIDWGLGLILNSFHYRNRPTSYGYGKHASRRAVGHGGRQSSAMFCDPEVGLSVAVCCNGMPGEPGHHRRMQPVLTAIYEDLGLIGS
ncbi:MAG TPA: serine hydrolase domain-containing protein [Acidimicrobiales bacterium]|nr:serine hydrolase domain-containing protein [Acidimicrobiales bacterium]